MDFNDCYIPGKGNECHLQEAIYLLILPVT